MAEEIFKIWYRSLLPSGRVWCESSSQAEVVSNSHTGCTFQRLVIKLVNGDWEPWEPPQTEVDGD